MKTVLGFLLYLLDPVFRAFVSAKRIGPDDPESVGEEIIAVLLRPSGRMVIK